MTKKQKEKIKTIIQHCCQVDGQLIEDGRFCVIGSLLSAAGYSNDHIEKIQSDDPTGLNSHTPYLNRLEKTFGLGKGELSDLQCVNDDYSYTKERREALLEKLEEFPVGRRSRE